MAAEQQEGSLDRYGPYVVWVGLLLVVAVLTFEMLNGDGRPDTGEYHTVVVVSTAH